MIKNTHNIGGLPVALNRVVAFAGLVLISPLFVFCAIVVKLSSPGPILFRQKRVGINGRTFTMVKFRTMYFESTGSSVTASNDTRITGFGAFLRRYKLDELPELLNVMRGDMAFVGPRPEVPEMVDLSNELWTETLKVLPGITDPVTLYLRNEEAYLAEVEDKEIFYTEVLQPFKLNGYLRYSMRRTWKSDLSVVFRTVFALFKPIEHEMNKLEDHNYHFLEESL